MSAAEHSVPVLLNRLRGGDAGAKHQLLEMVYEELRRIAGLQLRGERPGHTLQATALVHEAYLKLSGMEQIPWEGRAHFFAVAAQVIRRILVDHARAKRAAKRGGGAVAVELPDSLQGPTPKLEDVLALDAALEKLERLDPRQKQVVEMRYFGGMTEEEIGEVLGVSSRTIKREWRMARAWLFGELSA